MRSVTQRTTPSTRKSRHSHVQPAATLTLVSMVLAQDPSQSKPSPRPPFRSLALTAFLSAPAIPMPVSMMNPKVRDFRPSSYPHESSFIGSSSGYGHNRAMSHPGPNYYSHGNMYHNAPPGMVYPDQFPLTSTGHPAPYGQLAQHAPNPAALTYKTPTKKEIKAMAAARDAHKPGKQCPEGHAFCHWHYANWCHDDPATCRPARKFSPLLVHYIFTDSMLQCKQLPPHSMLTAPGRMPPRAGMQPTRRAFAKTTPSCVPSTPSFTAENLDPLISPEIQAKEKRVSRYGS